ncbi:MAG: hypothetical protein ACI89L_001153 [Phycisphaerales bacterium]|jgi:hypothetical protein
MSGRRGFSLKTFYSKGAGEGLQLVEHTQWIGKAVAIARHELDKHEDRPEFGQTGVYVLHGKNPQTGCERMMVGRVSQLDKVDVRIESMDFWNRIILFTADGPRLHEVHAEFIEARLIQQAGSGRFAELENAEAATVPPLPEADQADAEYFVEQAVNALTALGVRAFETAPGKRRSSEIVHVAKHGAKASGFEVAGRFVVQSGSSLARVSQDDCPGYIKSLRESLTQRGVLADSGKTLKMKMDFAFDTAAEAAMVVTGERACGGAWRTTVPSKTESPKAMDDSMPGRSAQGAAPGEAKKPEAARPVAVTAPAHREVQMPASLRSLTGRDSNNGGMM